MTDMTDKVAFAAAELNAASDALASAAAEVDALRAEVARQAGIAVDHCARADREAIRAAEMEAQAQREQDRADAAEQMVVDLRGLLQSAHQAVVHEAGIDDDAQHLSDIIDAALSRTEAVAGRWVPVGVAAGIAKRCDAAIAARDEAVREMHSSDSAARMLGDDFARVLRDCTAAERARDEVGIQLAAAQAEIARLRRVVDETRTLMATPACERLPAERAVCDALHALDTVPGDALVRP